MRTFLAVLVWTLVAGSGYAVVESRDVMPEDFNSEAQRERYNELIEELRCTVCQNQNLADSNAELAKDLRVQVLEQIQQGMTNEQITDYLVERYSEFVLYRPPFNPATYLLWIGPFIALIAAVAILLILIRRRQQARAQFSDADKQALASALREAGGRGDSTQSK